MSASQLAEVQMAIAAIRRSGMESGATLGLVNTLDKVIDEREELLALIAAIAGSQKTSESGRAPYAGVIDVWIGQARAVRAEVER